MNQFKNNSNNNIRYSLFRVGNIELQVQTLNFVLQNCRPWVSHSTLLPIFVNMVQAVVPVGGTVSKCTKSSVILWSRSVPVINIRRARRKHKLKSSGSVSDNASYYFRLPQWSYHQRNGKYSCPGIRDSQQPTITFDESPRPYHKRSLPLHMCGKFFIDPILWRSAIIRNSNHYH